MSVTCKGISGDRHAMYTQLIQWTDLAGSCQRTLWACLAVLPPHTTIQQLLTELLFMCLTVVGVAAGWVAGCSPWSQELTGESKKWEIQTTQQGRTEYTVRVLWKEELTPSDWRLKKDFIEEMIFDIGFWLKPKNIRCLVTLCHHLGMHSPLYLHSLKALPSLNLCQLSLMAGSEGIGREW